MTEFSSSRSDTATLDASREATWAALTDPSLIGRITPFLREVDDLGDGRWRWDLVGIPYPGGHFSASFTERMTFTEGERIVFTHEPPSGRSELAGADGSYTLRDRTDGQPGTIVSIDVGVSATLPFPRWGRRAVIPAMDAVLALMGDRFSRGLLEHLGTGPREDR